MNKLAKRTLAILLVVCALFGLVAMPAAALAEPTQTDPKTYVYDFTALSQLKTVAEGAEPMWKTSTRTDPYYGFGNRRLATGDSTADDWMNDFYDIGYRNGNTTAEPIYYYKDLTWKVSAVQQNEALTVWNNDGSAEALTQMDRVFVGGYYYSNEASKFSFDGIRYQAWSTYTATLADGVTEGTKSKEDCGGWVAITIKAPEVGTYTVSLDHLQTKYGATQGSVYIVPGAVSDVATIQGYVDNGTGKLENTVDYFESYATINASTAENKKTGLPATNDEMGFAVNTTLGTVTLSEPCEEYTVIFTNELNRYGNTDQDCARIYLEALTFTQQAEAPFTLGDDRNYSFDLTTYINDGTFTNSTNFETEGYAEKLDALYDTLGWDFLGSTFTSYNRIDKNYLYLNGGGTNSAPAYVAFKLKSPGEGDYQLDFTGYIMTKPSTTDTTKAKTSHMWMDALIVKLDENKVETAYADYIATAEEIGTYDPEYSDQYSSTNQYISNTLGTYTFEEGADYILYLRRNPESDTSTTDNDDTYAPNNAYPRGLTATALPATAATVGEDYIAPDAKLYGFDRQNNNTAIKTLHDTYKNMYTDGSDDGMDDEGNVTGYLLGYHTASPDFTYEGTDYNIESNIQFLQYSNSSTKKYYYHYNAETGVYTFAPNGTQITNQLLKNGLAAKYEEFGWELLGMSNPAGLQFNNGYTYIYSVSNDNYVAIKLKSPGNGNFDVDMELFHAAAAGNNCHMGLKVYIVEADKAVYSVDNDLKLTATLPETPDAQYVPVYDADLGGTATAVELVKYGTEEDFTYDFVADTDYIVYLQRDSATTKFENKEDTDANGTQEYSPNNVYLTSITATPTRESESATPYTTLTEALAAAAETGKTVHLEQDVLLSEVVIPENVTLDLNGHTLTTAAVGPTGKLVGEGVVKTYAGADTFTNADLFADNTLPLYDAAAQGYKFYEYSLGNGVAVADEAADAVKFWYQFQFTGDKKAEAYTLVASGTSGLAMGVNVTVDGASTFCSFENKKDVDPAIENDPAAWAAAYASFAAGATDPWLWVNVTSASLAESLSVAPVVKVGGVEIVGANIQ